MYVATSGHHTGDYIASCATDECQYFSESIDHSIVVTIKLDPGCSPTRTHIQAQHTGEEVWVET
jgi:hypothetical protein